MRNKLEALKVEDYSPEYKTYLEEELKLLDQIIKPGFSVLDVGCGAGRIIPLVAPEVKSYLGIDIDSNLLKVAREVSAQYLNSRVKYERAEHLLLEEERFDLALCLWNTLGNIDCPRKALQGISKVSNNALITVVRKGNLEARKRFYEVLDMPYQIEPGEVFVSSFGKSRAFSEQEIRELTTNCNAQIDIQPIGTLAYSVFLRH